MLSARPRTDRALTKGRRMACGPLPTVAPTPFGGLLSAACQCALQASTVRSFSSRCSTARGLLSVLSAALATNSQTPHRAFRPKSIREKNPRP
jgi:hypothetical protein